MLTEQDLEDAGFEKKLMPGTGWASTISMCDTVYYYTKGCLAINATRFWTWFSDNQQRNDIAVSSKEELDDLIQTYK